MAALLLAGGCNGDGDAPRDGGADGGSDGGVLGEWPHSLPSTSLLGDRRGRRIVRAIIHMHSPLSHDACDGEGWADGGLADEPCLEHMREAVCTLRVDALMLTDHAPHVNEVPFDRGLWIDEARGDVPVVRGETTVASRMACPDGHSTLVTAGSENALMPVSLASHPGDPSDPEALGAIYDADGAAAVQTFRDAGAAVLVPHTESRTLDYLRTLGADGLEIYNTHANVDPGIREDYLGLSPSSHLADLLAFANPSAGLTPDLAFLAFYAPNDNALAKWDTLLSEGVRMTGVGGCDAHENTLPSLLPDGERGDSYRRMMRWFSNHLLVDEPSWEGTTEAVRAGRSYVAFEAFGTPVGFDYVALDDQVSIEMGETAGVGATLRVSRPHLPEGHPSTPAPEVTLRLLRSAPGGAVEVARGQGEVLEHTPTDPGAYRAEVLIVPLHAGPFLGSLAEELVREVAWIHSNPIHVQ